MEKSTAYPLHVGRSFLLGSRGPVSTAGRAPHYFGHVGALCTHAFADPDLGLAIAHGTHGNAGALDRLLRFAPLGSAILRARVR